MVTQAELAGIDLSPEVLAMLRARPEILAAVTKAAKREYQTLEINDFVARQTQVSDTLKAMLTAEKAPDLFRVLETFPEDRSMVVKLTISTKGIEVFQTGTPKHGSNGNGSGFSREAIMVVYDGTSYPSCRQACIGVFGANQADPDGCGNPHTHHKCKVILASKAKKDGVPCEFVAVAPDPASDAKDNPAPAAPEAPAPAANDQQPRRRK